jgi:hypothetical protein
VDLLKCILDNCYVLDGPFTEQFPKCWIIDIVYLTLNSDPDHLLNIREGLANQISMTRLTRVVEERESSFGIGGRKDSEA